MAVQEVVLYVLILHYTLRCGQDRNGRLPARYDVQRIVETSTKNSITSP